MLIDMSYKEFVNIRIFPDGNYSVTTIPLPEGGISNTDSYGNIIKIVNDKEKNKRTYYENFQT
jgi:hypothetical protein